MFPNTCPTHSCRQGQGQGSIKISSHSLNSCPRRPRFYLHSHDREECLLENLMGHFLLIKCLHCSKPVERTSWAPFVHEKACAQTAEYIPEDRKPHEDEAVTDGMVTHRQPLSTTYGLVEMLVDYVGSAAQSDVNPYGQVCQTLKKESIFPTMSPSPEGLTTIELPRNAI